MKKSASIIEIAILGLLIVAAVYYYVIHKPISEELSQLESELIACEEEMELAQTKLADQNRMQAAIDEAVAQAEGNPQTLPYYDNVGAIILEFNEILGAEDGYSMTFTVEDPEDHIVRRDVSLQFSGNDFESILAQLHQIELTQDRFLLKDLTLSKSTVSSGSAQDQSYDVSYSVSVSMTGFEYTAE